MSSRNPVDKPSNSPNQFVFPPFFTDKTVIGALKSYTPDELMTRITQDANAVDYIGKIYVTQIRYYKQSTGLEHEYLVIKVEATDRQFVNNIKIDRCPDTAPEKVESHAGVVDDTTPRQDVSLPKGRMGSHDPKNSILRFAFPSSSSFIFGKQNARDMLHIPDSAGLSSLIDRTTEVLGTVEVPFGYGPTLEAVVMLASFVSAYQPLYHLLSAQCYWYAYTIWKLLLAAFPESLKFEGELVGAGTNRLIPRIEWHKQEFEQEGRYAEAREVTETHRHAALVAKFLVTWHDLEGTIPDKQKNYGAQAKQESLRQAEEAAASAQEAATLAQEVAASAQEAAASAQEAATLAQEAAALAQEENVQLRRRLAELEGSLEPAATTASLNV